MSLSEGGGLGAFVGALEVVFYRDVGEQLFFFGGFSL